MTSPALVDSHCHLDVEEFDADRTETIERAQGAGVAAMLTLGTDLASSARAVELASSHPSIYAASGLHPNDAAKFTQGMWPAFEALAAHPRVIAWGEIGLDYHWDFATKEQQHQVFRDQLALARDAGLPIVVHIRKSHEDTLAILSEPAFRGVSGILHCWSGDLETARRGIDIGYLIGIGGPITYKKSTLPELVRKLPWETLVVETDAPYLAPVPLRGKRNEPALVRHAFDTLVATKGDLTPERAAATLWANFQRVFKRFRVPFESAGTA
jgi:TatD DNase family protein